MYIQQLAYRYTCYVILKSITSSIIFQETEARVRQLVFVRMKTEFLRSVILIANLIFRQAVT